MFVNRSGQKSLTEKTVSMDHSKSQKRAAVIGLAVAATVSVVSVTFSRLHAEDASLDSSAIRPLSLQAEAATDLDLLKQAVSQYKNKQYEDAKASLDKVNAGNLSGSDQSKLASVAADVDRALEGRKDARAKFAEGQTALEAGNTATAKPLYEAARDARYADDATRQKAKEQLALIADMQQQKAAEQKASYQQAKKDLEAGNYAEAQAKFTKLQQEGFKAPLFQTSPESFLKEIEKKTAAPAAAAPAPAPDQAAADKAAAAAAAKAAEEKADADKKAAELAAQEQKQKANEAYKAGLAALKANDFAAARASFTAADQAGFKPGIFEASAAKMLAEVDRKEADSKAKAEGLAAAPAPAPAPAVDQAAADKAAADAAAKAAEEKAAADKAAADLAAKDQKQKANEAYKAGLAALKANDFAAARASFKTADESGFRPGLFEASAAKMLAEVDRKETEAKAAAEGTAAADQAAADKAKQEAERKAAADKAAADQAAANLAAKEQKQKANDAYKTGLAALRANDFAAARASFKTADESGFRPGLFEASAAKMLAEVDRKEAEAQAKTAQAAAPAPAPVETPAPAVTPAPAPAVTPAPAATPAPAPVVDPEAQAKADKAAAEAAARAEKEAAAARQVAARDQYKAGLAALKAGDYATARTSFKAADESGFKPGLFEASAAKMLAEVDQVEADAKAKAERTAAREAEKAERERVKTEKAAAEAQAKADKQAAEATALANKEAVEVKPGETPAKVEESSPARQQLEATAKMDQIRQQARAYESQRLTEQAQAAQAEGRVATALESYNKAVEADPSNQVAVDGRNQLLALQGRPAMPTTLLEDQQKLNQVRRESIAFAFNDAIDRTRASIAAENYKAAQLQLDSAVVAREQDPNLFTRDEVAQMDATIAQTQVELRQGREAFERAERQRVADAKAATERERLRLEEEERRNTIAALVKDSRRYISQNKYPEALATIDQIVAIDPNNDYASAVRPLVEDRALLQEQRKYREDFNRQYQRQMTQAEEKKIPYGDIYRYPENWPDIVDARDRFVIEERGQKAGDRELQLLLEKRLPEVKIEGQPFDEVINFLRDLTGANIVVRWAALEQAAIDRKTPVNVNLRDVKFSKVLKTVLESVSNDPNTRLTYTVSEGVITIYVTQEASAEAAALDTRVYDITDLMYVIPEYQDLNTGNAGGGGTGGGGGTNTGGGRSGTSSGSGSSRSSGGGSSRSSGGGGRSSGRSSGGGGRSTSGGGGGLFGGGGGGGYGGGGRGGTSGGGTGGGGLSTDSFTRMEDVRYLITETVNVDSWDDNGGPGSARPSPLQKHLIITQTPEVHANIEKLLAQLREAKAIQVTVETRFLKVNRNFLEDIGMDFDFAWNFNGGPNAKWSPIGVSQNSSDFTANPNTGIPGTLAGNTPSPSATIGAPGGGAGTYLDDFQVNFLIRATQATVNQAVVTAPRVTVYNGGAAVVWVTTSSPYVASLTPEVASGVVGYTPEIETADDGIELAVQAFVSHDRKYVTLYLEPTLTDVISIQNFSYQEASTLPTGGSGVGNVFTSQPTLTIQEPVTEEIGVQTTVNVPDGGTLLLGGQTVAGEIEREAGVPVLSKIPILKRFFTNRSMAKDENVLLILVKPTIIIQQEQEAKQFPLLSSKISGQ